jgi:hypothetical protein
VAANSGAALPRFAGRLIFFIWKSESEFRFHNRKTNPQVQRDARYAQPTIQGDTA